MGTRRLTPTDAQTFWMSAKIPNDTFLLFAFAGVPSDLEATLDDVASRAGASLDLTVRIDDRGGLSYPAWVRSRRRPFAVRGARPREPFVGGLSGRGEPADRRPAGRAGGGVAAARLPGRRRRAGSPGGRHGGHTPDLACARWRWADLGACSADVRQGRRGDARHRRTARWPVRLAAAGGACRQGPSSVRGRCRGGKSFRHKRICARCCGPMPGRPARRVCARWSGSAPNYPGGR